VAKRFHHRVRRGHREEKDGWGEKVIAGVDGEEKEIGWSG
jgi:hypothetical protein